ncbi:hypothetical protein ACVBEH_28415, partial [Roseateles sp. GG27B]
ARSVQIGSEAGADPDPSTEAAPAKPAVALAFASAPAGELSRTARSRASCWLRKIVNSLRRNSTRLCSRCESKLIARIFSEVGFIIMDTCGLAAA